MLVEEPMRLASDITFRDACMDVKRLADKYQQSEKVIRNWLEQLGYKSPTKHTRQRSAFFWASIPRDMDIFWFSTTIWPRIEKKQYLQLIGPHSTVEDLMGKTTRDDVIGFSKFIRNPEQFPEFGKQHKLREVIQLMTPTWRHGEQPYIDLMERLESHKKYERY